MIFQNIIKDKYLKILNGLSLFILVLAAVIFCANTGLITTPLIIHYDVYRGIDFLGGQIDVFGIILSTLIMISINLFLSNFLYNRERFLSYLFAFVNLELTLLILIVISVIISVN
jgi:hypothetical protein